MKVKLTMNKTLGVPTWNITAGDTCPGRSKWCALNCYACKGNFQYSNVQSAHERNWLSTQDLASWTDAMVAEVQAWAAKGFNRIRVHSAGDFFSVDYFRAWLDVADRCPDVEFFTYTRTWRTITFAGVLAEAEARPNFTLWFSTDETTGLPESAPRIAYILDKGGFYSPDMPQPNCDKQMLQDANCASCGKCFHRTQTAVTFKAH
jgi:hypothetical protein